MNHFVTFWFKYLYKSLSSSLILLEKKAATRGVLRNFAKFTVKHLCQSPFFNKVAALSLTTLLKRDSGAGVFHWILQNFLEHLQTTASVESAKFTFSITSISLQGSCWKDHARVKFTFTHGFDYVLEVSFTMCGNPNKVFFSR